MRIGSLHLRTAFSYLLVRLARCVLLWLPHGRILRRSTAHFVATVVFLPALASFQALRQFTVAELAGAILRRLGVVASGTPAVGPRFLFWFLKCGARYPKLFGRVFTLFPLSSCDSLNVRSGLLFFTAGHRNFWARGRFLGQKPRIPAYVQASFSRGTLGNRSVRFGISLGFDPKSRSRAQKCDGRRRKRVTESTHKTDI